MITDEQIQADVRAVLGGHLITWNARCRLDGIALDDGQRMTPTEFLLAHALGMVNLNAPARLALYLWHPGPPAAWTGRAARARVPAGSARRGPRA